ncbi:MAG: hypothetical protein V9G12_17540 [Microthrixaceae bacterium]
MNSSLRSPSGHQHRHRSTTTTHRTASLHDPLRCGVCNDQLVQIDLLVDGRSLTLRSCGDCQRRVWFDRSDRVPLDGILTVITEAAPRYRRDMSADAPGRPPAPA